MKAKGYVCFDEFRKNKPEEFPKPKSMDIKVPTAKDLGSDGHWDSSWLEEKYPERFAPDTTWKWNGDEMVEVEVVEDVRQVNYTKKEGKKIRYKVYNDFVTKGKRWDKDGELVKGSQEKREAFLREADLDSILGTKKDVEKTRQLSLFL